MGPRISAETGRVASAGLMLAHRQRRWPNIKPLSGISQQTPRRRTGVCLMLGCVVDDGPTLGQHPVKASRDLSFLGSRKFNHYITKCVLSLNIKIFECFVS